MIIEINGLYLNPDILSTNNIPVVIKNIKSGIRKRTYLILTPNPDWEYTTRSITKGRSTMNMSKIIKKTPIIIGNNVYILTVLKTNKTLVKSL